MEHTQTIPGAPPITHGEGAPAIPAFEIIPVKAIPLVALAVLGLVAAIVSEELWALEFAHVVAGGLWTGIDLFVGLIIGPILGRLSPQGRVEFSTRFMPKMVLLMPTLVAITLVAGWSLANHTGDIAVAYPDHWWLTASFIVVGIMSVIALGFLEPANLAVLFELKKPQPDPELIGRLMKRFVYAAGITGVMQLATLIIMTRIATW